MKANLLNCVGDVGPGECEVLKSAYKAAVGGRISHGGPASAATLAQVSTGVVQGLQSLMPWRAMISRVYCCWERKSESLRC